MENRAHLGEGRDALATMMVTLARHADPCERQIVLGDMQEGVVASCAPGRHAVYKPLGHRLLIGDG